jgi:hypothetical protein
MDAVLQNALQAAGALRGLPLIWMAIDAANDVMRRGERQYTMMLHGERWRKEFRERDQAKT